VTSVSGTTVTRSYRFAENDASGGVTGFAVCNGGQHLVLAEQRGAESRCGVVLHVFSGVLVQVSRDSGGRVAEPFGDDLQRHALLEHERRRRVARVVQSDAAHAGVPDEPVEPLRHPVRVQRLPRYVAEHEPPGRDTRSRPRGVPRAGGPGAP
jgi:hypothetical protein